MDRQRLSSFAVLQIRRLVPVDFDKVIDGFTSNRVEVNRKLPLE